MTQLGTDISSFQAGLRLADLKFASFVVAKCSQGTFYTDPDYPGWRTEANHLGMPFGWYHFLSTEDAAAQVEHTLSCVGNPSLPGMLDVEPYLASHPSIAAVLAYADEAKARGLNLRLIYWPHWYWVQCGSPDLTPLKDRGLILVSSAYPGGTGTPAQLYPGDTATGWNSYGNMAPGVYQYSSQAPDGGQSLDYNAIRNPSVFDQIFGGSMSTPTAQVLDDSEENWLKNLYYGMFYGGSSTGPTVPAGFPGAGSNSMFAHLEYIRALLESLTARPVPTPVDPAALAKAVVADIDLSALGAAIAAHIAANPGADANSIAVAVAGYFAQKLAVTG